MVLSLEEGNETTRVHQSSYWFGRRLAAAVSAQQAERMRRVGVLMGIANDSDANARAVALQEGLRVLGWTTGRNIQIDYSYRR